MTPLDRLRALHAAAPSPLDISNFRSDGIAYRGLSRDPSDDGTSTLVARFYDPDSEAYQRKVHATHNALPSLLACVAALREILRDLPSFQPNSDLAESAAAGFAALAPLVNKESA